MTGHELGELADVHLDEAPSHDKASHGREDTRGPGQLSGATANRCENCLHQMITLRTFDRSVPAGMS